MATSPLSEVLKWGSEKFPKATQLASNRSRMGLWPCVCEIPGVTGYVNVQPPASHRHCKQGLLLLKVVPHCPSGISLDLLCK